MKVFRHPVVKYSGEMNQILDLRFYNSRRCVWNLHTSTGNIDDANIDDKINKRIMVVFIEYPTDLFAYMK